MAIRATRDAVSRIFYQRCFWLFAVLLTLIAVVTFVPSSDAGRLTVNAFNMLVLIAAVAAVGRTTSSFAVALLLAIPATLLAMEGGVSRGMVTCWSLLYVCLIINPDGRSQHAVTTDGHRRDAAALGTRAGQDVRARAGSAFFDDWH